MMHLAIGSGFPKKYLKYACFNSKKIERRFLKKLIKIKENEKTINLDFFEFYASKSKCR